MKKQSGWKPAWFRNVVLLLLLSGMTALLVQPVSSAAPLDTGGRPAVTITAEGSRSYYLGEKVYLSGQNTDSDTTYLFITGPNIPEGGAKLTSPRKAVVGGNPDTFTLVTTKADKTWDYAFYTANLPYDAGSYTLYAVGNPVAFDQFGNSTTYGTVSIILKKPFLSADISPVPVVNGKGFSVTGFAEGDPPEVQVWIIGNNYALTAKNPVDPNASFTYTVTEAMSGSLAAGQYSLFVQHPMQNNQFDITVSGEFVRNLNLNNGTDLFKISGAGSLQGSDAADALVAAFSDPAMKNVDTYTVIPFQVTDQKSSAPPQAETTTAPVQQTARQDPLQYALLGGAILVVAGIVVWKRQ